MRKAAIKTKKFQIWNCPTLVVTGIRTDSLFQKNLPNQAIGKKLVPVMNWWQSQNVNLDDARKLNWAFQKKMAKVLYQKGAKLLAGSDSPAPWVVPGLGLHYELKYMVEAGMSNYDAIKTATRNPADWFGLDYKKGTIEPGKQADLIILNENPLVNIEDTQNIKVVIRNGKLINP